MSKFKKGDTVRSKDKSIYGIVSNTYSDVFDMKDGSIGWAESCFNLVKKRSYKPDTMVRYMVYGTGCDNHGKLKEYLKELKADLKQKTNDGDWSGRLIGYKLTPILEAKKSTRITAFKK